MSDSRSLAAAGVSTRRGWVIMSVLVICGVSGRHEGCAEDDTIVDRRPAHWYTPPGFDGGLVAYDLTAACAENARQRDAGMPYNAACFMLRDFATAYHPGVTFAWQQPRNQRSWFVGTILHEKGICNEVFVRWQSLSDGLQLEFDEVRLTRRSDADPFSIVADAVVRQGIRRATGSDATASRCDVFLIRVRKVVADDRAEGLGFQPSRYDDGRYGVVVDGSVRFFTKTGVPWAERGR